MGQKWPEIVVKRPFNTLLRFPKKGGGYYKTEILATLILESLCSKHFFELNISTWYMICGLSIYLKIDGVRSMKKLVIRPMLSCFSSIARLFCGWGSVNFQSEFQESSDYF